MMILFIIFFYLMYQQIWCGSYPFQDRRGSKLIGMVDSIPVITPAKNRLNSMNKGQTS